MCVNNGSFATLFYLHVDFEQSQTFHYNSMFTGVIMLKGESLLQPQVICRFSISIVSCSAPSIFVKLISFSAPARETHLHIMMLPTSCFTPGKVVDGVQLQFSITHHLLPPISRIPYSVYPGIQIETPMALIKLLTFQEKSWFAKSLRD